MQHIFRQLRSWMRSAVQSLAFLPLPMVVAGLLIGVGLFYLETATDWTHDLLATLPYAILSSQDTARAVLGLIIGGTMTLTVFTFTQMMTLFSQVASSYSPRLLPMFTGSRQLQFVMGTYLATIVVNIIILLSIRSDEEGYVPNFSVLVCIFLGVCCLMLFIYFVTTVSNKIQVNNILRNIYEEGEQAIIREENRKGFHVRAMPVDVPNWYAISSPIDGFIGTVDHERLSALAREYGTVFYIGTARGRYVPRHLPLLQTKAKLTETQINEVLKAVSPVQQKFVDWHLPPIRLLTEIAVKAMSPGINDPVTAINALDRLTGLFLRLMHLPEYNVYLSPDEKTGAVWFANAPFSRVLGESMQSLRQYCKADVLVMRRIFDMLFHFIASAKDSPRFQRIVRTELRALLEDARVNIYNSTDRSVLAGAIRQNKAYLQRLFEDTDFLLDPHLKDPGVKSK